MQARYSCLKAVGLSPRSLLASLDIRPNADLALAVRIVICSLNRKRALKWMPSHLTVYFRGTIVPSGSIRDASLARSLVVK